MVRGLSVIKYKPFAQAFRSRRVDTELHADRPPFLENAETEGVRVISV
jgi:hypothetical protein